MATGTTANKKEADKFKDLCGPMDPKLDRDMREKFRGHEWFADTEEFIDKYDCPSFDPDYDTLPLEFFEPMVMKLFRHPLNSIYKREAEAVA